MAKNKKAPKIDGYSAKDIPGTFTVSVVASLESNTAKFIGNCVNSDTIGNLIHQCQQSGKSVTFSHSGDRIVIDGQKEKHTSIIFALTERRGQVHKILKGIDLVYKLDETLDDFYNRIINRRETLRSKPSGAASTGYDGSSMPSTLVPSIHVQRMMTERGFLWSNIEDVIGSSSSQSSHQIGGCVKYRKDGVEVVVAPVDFRLERKVITVYKVDADAPPLRDQKPLAPTASAQVVDPHALLTCVDRLIKLVLDKKAEESLEDKNHLRHLEHIYSYTTDLDDASSQDVDVLQINSKIVLCLLSIVDIDTVLLHRETAIEVLASVRATFAAAYKLCMQSPESYGFDVVAGKLNGTGVADVELLLTFQRRLLHLPTFGLDMPATYHADLTAMVRHLRAVSGSNSPASIRKEVNEVYNAAHKVLKSVPRPVDP